MRNKGEFERSIADYNEAIRLNPQYAIAFNNRGYAWATKKDQDRAISDFNEALRMNPQYALAFNNRGDAWKAKGDFQRMMADYTEAVRIDPENAEFVHDLAWELAANRNDKIRNGIRAVELARKVCELTQWKNANYIDTLAAAYAEAGQFSEAVRWQEKALEDAGIAKNAGSRRRLALYKEGKAFRESRSVIPP